MLYVPYMYYENYSDSPVIKEDFWEYWDTGWKDSDGNWWRPSGSVYVWNDYGDFERNGKTGMCLFEPDWNRDVKEGGIMLDRKDFSRNTTR